MYEKLEPQSGMLSETQEPLIHHNWRPLLRYLAKKIFFVVNNTPGDFSDDHFILRGEYFKINNTGSLRLYEVVE